MARPAASRQRAREKSLGKRRDERREMKYEGGGKGFEGRMIGLLSRRRGGEARKRFGPSREEKKYVSRTDEVGEQ